jgi:cytochrome P450
MMWVVLQINKDTQLRSEIRKELSEEGLHGTLQPEDIKKLLVLPRLQGIYAECLRLFDSPIIPRETTEEVQVNGWKFPKDSTIIISAHEAQMDDHVWNTGTKNAHPIDTFWAERFLIYPKDPSSGPIRKIAIIQSGRGETQDEAGDTGKENGPVFAEKITAGHWIPYGGGARICPGRHFAKRAVLTAAAMMTMMVDIEILATEKAMHPDDRSYGIGVLRPKDKVPYRIRKRHDMA